MDEGILARRLKKLREEHGYYQKSVADKLGIKSNTLSGYENGTRMPDPSMLSKIADLYNVSTDYLLGKDKFKNKKTEKEERDVAKRMDELRDDLSSATGLLFNGEPMSEEAKESLLEAMEFGIRLAKKNNKKFINKKYRDEEE